MAVVKLAISTLLHRRARLALTMIAIALSVSLVVAVTSGYASLEAAIFRYFAEFMGSTDVRITPIRYTEGLPESLVHEVRDDRDVRTAVARFDSDTNLVDLEGKPLPGRQFQRVTLIGADLPADVEIASLKMDQQAGIDTGGWFNSDEGDVAVLDQEAAKLLNVKVGDSMLLPHPTKPPLKLKIVGIVRKPAIIAQWQSTAYIPLKTLQRFADAPGRVTTILVDVQPGANPDKFAERWQAKLASAPFAAKLATHRETRKEIDQHLEGAQLLSYMGGTVSMLAATFIVFSTLSMGVSERQRTLAMLRAVGARKWQVGALVIIEGIVLAVCGVLIGIPLGLLWVKILTAWKTDIFIAGSVISVGGILFGAVGSIGTALLASFLPAWTAMRVDPVEGMTSATAPASSAIPVKAAIIGALLLLVDPLIIFTPGVPSWLVFYGHFGLGLPSLMIGAFLLSPAFVWLIEKTFGRLVSMTLCIRHELVAQQLTGSIWRAAGTAAALSVGLAILVVMQTQGNSFLNGWKLPTNFPDIFIFSRAGLTMDQIKVVETVEGIKKGEVLPIVVTIARLPQGFLSNKWLAAVMPDATMFLGVDPDKALQMLQLDFRAGNAADAAAMLKKGRHVIVTEEFRELKGITVGGKFKIKTPKHGEVEYTVAGVVWSPGIDVFVSTFDMGQQFNQRSASSVFGSVEDAQRDFDEEKVHLFAANLENDVDKFDLEKRVQDKLGALGLISGDVRQIKANIQNGLRKLLLLMSTIALAAIGVASLGVTNTVMASVRTRRWQLGVLRSIGVTRMQVLRLILAEGVLLGLVGCALGLATGLLMSVDANGFSRRLIGYRPPIDVPWDMVGWGLLIILCVAIIASIWPAVSASREEPLELLQAGRASA